MLHVVSDEKSKFGFRQAPTCQVWGNAAEDGLSYGSAEPLLPGRDVPYFRGRR